MISAFPLRSALPFDVPVEPDDRQARKWLETELARPEYQDARPGWAEQLITAVLEWLGDVLSGIQGLGSGAGVLLLGLGALLVLALAVLVIRPRLNARRKPSEGIFEDAAAEQDAAGHRRLAEHAAAAGDWDTALAERLRAVLRSAEERVILDRRPGRTAGEAGAALSSVFPGAGTDIRWLSARFDEVKYGGAHAEATDSERAARLDAELLRTEPVQAHLRTEPVLAVPK
ncbi:DUF4129 domain-containing protein [Arthrobacter sp. 7Tela_A1]|uniref:DUF4129 domain-containing protein n=1 Tax=Arthrobacter sp. 7Tela_A1 TaxID=3093745 RepID=UPI003BB7BBFE